VPAFHLYPLETIVTRSAWLGLAAQNGRWLAFGHDCSTAFARVARDARPASHFFRRSSTTAGTRRVEDIGIEDLFGLETPSNWR
jgi:hypothetical protein